MISNIFAFVRFAPLAIFLCVAIAGAFAALIGGLAGWVDVTNTASWPPAAGLWDFSSGFVFRL
ncbi:hypothetical protein [Bradyrhizobium sp. LMTR 3]|uniref:hypothetical protein n=1 Tax=Bradyrhizobium sp. LMTR 3 TaxID=189873 RepID=UPI0011461D33|nr:hypothetical protein [Bradyrhizobium sp. LMTR 3]